MVTCIDKGHYIKSIQDKSKLFSLNKSRVIFSIFSLAIFLKNKSDIFLHELYKRGSNFIKMFFLPKLKVIIRESNTISAKNKENVSIKLYFELFTKIFTKRQM